MGASLPPGVGRWAIDIGLPPQPSPSRCKGGYGGLGSLRTTDSRRAREPRGPLSPRATAFPSQRRNFFLHNCVPLGFCVLKRAFWKHGSSGSSWRRPRASPSPPLYPRAGRRGGVVCARLTAMNPPSPLPRPCLGKALGSASAGWASGQWGCPCHLVWDTLTPNSPAEQGTEPPGSEL